MMGKYLINWGKESRTEITDELLSLIASAQKNIKIGNFIFEYKEIVEGLKTAMDKDVAVFVLSNPLDGKEDAYKSHNDNLIQLASLGAHVRYLDDLHAKFVICDDIKGIVTSANNNENSLSRNSETGVIIQEQEAVQLSRVFNKLFLNADITQISNDTLTRVKSRQVNREFNIDEKTLLESRLRITINSKRETNLKGKAITNLYKEIVNIIDRAEKECFIVTWHFDCALDKRKKYKLIEFIESLNKAKERGVKITLYSNVKDTNPSQKTKNQPSLKLLSKITDDIYGDDNNHSKCVITESEGIVFSANIDPIGLETGFEVGVILSEDERSAALNHIHNLISANSNRIKF